MSRRRKKKRRRRRPAPGRGSRPALSGPSIAGAEGSVFTDRAVVDETAGQRSLFLEGEPAVGGQCLVGDGIVDPHVADQVRPRPSAVGAERVAEAAAERRRVQAALVEANRELRQAVASYRSEGATLRELGGLMGVSAQAVHKDWLPASSRNRSAT